MTISKDFVISKIICSSIHHSTSNQADIAAAQYHL